MLMTHIHVLLKHTYKGYPSIQQRVLYTLIALYYNRMQALNFVDQFGNKNILPIGGRKIPAGKQCAR